MFNESEDEASKDGCAVALEQILSGVDHNDLTAIEGIKKTDLRLGCGKQSVERWDG